MHLRPRPSPVRASGVPALALALVALAPIACAGRASEPSPLGLRQREAAGEAAPAAPVAVPMALAGARCARPDAASAGCACRVRTDPEETAPPAEGTKRFEIRLSATGGRARLESERLGAVEGAGPRERCFYVDVPVGQAGDFRFVSVADSAEDGVEPYLSISEYGPAGPYWYDVLRVTCRGSYGRCSREGADAWKESLQGRKRGRLDPCGSAVVTRLSWDTTGGLHARDGGLLRDFTVRFALEVKPFATRFPPGATECVPKE